MKRIIVLMLLAVLCAAPVQAKTLKQVVQTTTANDIAMIGGYAVGAVIKVACNIITLPFHLLEKVAK